jgi:hypothetical protein
VMHAGLDGGRLHKRHSRAHSGLENEDDCVLQKASKLISPAPASKDLDIHLHKLVFDLPSGAPYRGTAKPPQGLPNRTPAPV